MICHITIYTSFLYEWGTEIPEQLIWVAILYNSIYSALCTGQDSEVVNVTIKS